ncbi:MAG: ribosomal protein S18-alanine N-acetyltransferase [Chloroflexi bacterium]|nr:ribosomal protein S18-alanine N-acetyltransferase [Chloroflexota bacterium]
MQTAAVRHKVRPMNLGDIPQVMEIEEESFPTMWPPTAFKRELQQNRLARYLVALELRGDGKGDSGEEVDQEKLLLQRLAAQQRGGGGGGLTRFLDELRQMLGGEEAAPLPPEDQRAELVVGFVGVWLMVEEAHVVTIAVRESHRGRGIGELMLISALELAMANDQPLVTLECRVSNAVALSLYEKYGFQQVGLRPRYYTDNHEDAYVLTTENLSSAAYHRRFEQLKEEHRERCGDYELHL